MFGESGTSLGAHLAFMEPSRGTRRAVANRCHRRRDFSKESGSAGQLRSHVVDKELKPTVF